MPYSGDGVPEAKSASPMIAATSANAMRGERVLRSGAEGVIVVGAGVDNGCSFDISKIMELSKRLYHRSHERRYGHLHAEKIHHPATESLDLATIMRTLGDPVRLEIVRLLADDRPRVCGELSTALDIPASTGSYHLQAPPRGRRDAHPAPRGRSGSSRCGGTTWRRGSRGWSTC